MGYSEAVSKAKAVLEPLIVDKGDLEKVLRALAEVCYARDWDYQGVQLDDLTALINLPKQST